MKKIICLALALLTIFAFAGCSDKSDIPEGMQLVSGSDEKGYYFFAPEEWTVSNLGEVDAVYVSTVNTTSVTFTEINTDGFVIDDETLSAEDYFLYHYFEDTKSEFPAETSVTVNGDEVLLGSGDKRADKAVKYAYTYEYADVSYGFMQYLAVHNGSCYILTYSAINEVIEGYEQSRYDEYLEKFTAIVENFRFVDKTGTEGPKESYPADEYRLVTDKAIAGFEFYAPGSFALDYSSAIISASAADGSNVNMTEATGTGISTEQYIAQREEELGEFVTDFTIIKNGEAAKLGNVPEILGQNTSTSFAFVYEYTYVFNGETYHVYQILAVEGNLFNASGYVFTYTAKEENYDKHFDEVTAMIEKVVF